MFYVIIVSLVYELSAERYKNRAQTELPDIRYCITLNSDKKSADSHVLQEYIKNADDTYSVGQEVAKGDYEKCNKLLAQLFNAPKRETPVQTYEIYQLKSGDEMHDVRFEPYESLAKRGGKPDYANYEKVYEGNAADLSGDLGKKLESLYDKFNLDAPKISRVTRLAFRTLLYLTIRRTMLMMWDLSLSRILFRLKSSSRAFMMSCLRG